MTTEVNPEIRDLAIALAEAVRKDWHEKKGNLPPEEVGMFTNEQEILCMAVDMAITACGFTAPYNSNMTVSQCNAAVYAGMSDFIERNTISDELQ